VAIACGECARGERARGRGGAAAMKPAELPIDEQLERICGELRARGALVLVAEPGAGKTTRVPPAIAERCLAPDQHVLVLEPRRVAARAAARRIAAERGESVGGFAGYQVRFERRIGARTRVRVLTEGILARLLQADPALSGTGAVVIDEFHERSLEADLALALLQEVRASLRPDLLLVVMSATLEAEPVARFLGLPGALHVPGRAHPLEIAPLDPGRQASAPERALLGLRAALASGAGDVLAFLPGVGEILRTSEELRALPEARDCLVLPLYGELAPEEQDRALAPARQRKIVLATNLAESSLTVPGVRCVVDTGLARLLVHDAASGMDRLELRRISRASAAQRAGRAGREGPGRAWRVWPAAEQTLMPEHELPEVRRVDLSGALLQLAQWGVRDAREFAWYEAPERGALERARALLVELGALEQDSGAMTPLGRELAGVPAHPRLARMLVEARELGVLEAGAELAALLGSRARGERATPPNALARRGPRSAGPSDLLARWEEWHAALAGRGPARYHPGELRRIEQSADQLARALAPGGARDAGPARHAPRSDGEDEALLRVIWAGFPDRLARRLRVGEPEAISIGGQGYALAPESVVLDEEFFVALELDGGALASAPSGSARARVRAASGVRRAWLEQRTQQLRSERLTLFDEARGRVIGLVRRSYRGLALEESETGAPDAHEAARLLLEHVRADPQRWLRLPEEAERLRTRLQSIAAWMPELGWPDFGDEGLLELLPAWLEGCTSLQHVRELDWSAILRGALNPAQSRALERNAPETVLLPTGREARLEYAAGKQPVLAVRLQELFGLPQGPRVADGRVAVLLHLLAPNGRPVQVTSDLSSFWNNTYAQVRKDLRARYPRHAWPEDPWSAPPSARPKPRPRS